jgi:hypothetical protein
MARTPSHERGATLAARLTGLDRRWIFLLIGVVVCVPLLVRVRMPLAIGSAAERFHAAIEAVPDGSIVVMPLDYDPAFTAEVHPMAVAVLRRLFEKNVRVITLTLQPAGPPMADLAFATVGPAMGKQYGVDFVNLGYKSGNEIVVLAIGTTIRGTFPLDSHGTPLGKLPLMDSIDRLGQAKLLIEIAATSAGPIWVQQAQGRFHVPMVAGVAGVMAPEFYPYLQSGQVRGLLGGMAGAAEYETLSRHPGTAVRGMDAQSAAHVVIALLILLGNLLWFLGRRRPAAASGVALLCALALLGSGCGRDTRTTNDAAAPDTAREGSVFVITFENGPVDQVRIVRDTSNGIVVHGATALPTARGSRSRCSGAAPTAATKTAAVTVAKVALGRFQCEPLVGRRRACAPGSVRVRLTVSFAQGKQDDAVRAASGDGRRFTGPGMHTAPDGSMLLRPDSGGPSVKRSTNSCKSARRPRASPGPRSRCARRAPAKSQRSRTPARGRSARASRSCGSAA